MFFAIKNLSDFNLFEIQNPEKIVINPPLNTVFKTKEEFKEWCVKSTTNHYFLSLCEPINRSIRLSDNNPLKRCHGIIADYDYKITDNMVDSIIAKPICEFMPNFFCKTFSGNGRLIWLFESPLLFYNTQQYRNFIVLLSRKLRLSKWLPALDTAISNPAQYYEIGHSWRQINTVKLPSDILQMWLFDVTKKMDQEALGLPPVTTEIPIWEIEKEVMKKFPGRWQGEFKVGARGVRFWDPTATDPTGAVILDHGVMAFSGEQAFLSWEQILGSDFVEKYRANKLAMLNSKACFDGSNYWFYIDSTNEWNEFNMTLAQLYLRNMGLSAKKVDKHRLSEVEEALIYIATRNRVSRVVTLPNREIGLLSLYGKIYLNVRSHMCIQPADIPVKLTWEDGAKYFPFIQSLLTVMFYDEHKDSDNIESVLELGIDQQRIQRLVENFSKKYVPKSKKQMEEAGSGEKINENDSLVTIENKDRRSLDQETIIEIIRSVSEGFKPKEYTDTMMKDYGTQQLMALLAWLKYAYVTALKKDPKPGQVIIIAGPRNVGKTLFSHKIVGGLLGSFCDASGHLINNIHWTDDLISSAVWCIDDDQVLDDYQTLKSFKTKLKKYAANADIVLNQRYKTSQMVPAIPRIIVTCNTDAESLRILPSLDSNTVDKICLFKASGMRLKMPDRDTIELLIKKELPFFAKFLVDWEYPPDTLSVSGRFYVKAYHHPLLLLESRLQGGSAVVLEALIALTKNLEKTPVSNMSKSATDYEFTTMELYTLVSNAFPIISKDLKLRAFETCLGLLSRSGYPIINVYNKQLGIRYWKIPKDLHKLALEQRINNMNAELEDMGSMVDLGDFKT